MADSIVEPSSSAAMSSISSIVQNQQQAVNLNALNPNIIPIISADIQVENVSQQQQQQQQSRQPSSSDQSDEPETKRKKIEPSVLPSTSQTNEKLESRLGGILCCAVCLDLPKTAMYQVGFQTIYHFTINERAKDSPLCVFIYFSGRAKLERWFCIADILFREWCNCFELRFSTRESSRVMTATAISVSELSARPLSPLVSSRREITLNRDEISFSAAVKPNGDHRLEWEAKCLALRHIQWHKSAVCANRERLSERARRMREIPNGKRRNVSGKPKSTSICIWPILKLKPFQLRRKLLVIYFIYLYFSFQIQFASI